jgi:hypothetical protein
MSKVNLTQSNHFCVVGLLHAVAAFCCSVNHTPEHYLLTKRRDRRVAIFKTMRLPTREVAPPWLCDVCQQHLAALRTFCQHDGEKVCFTHQGIDAALWLAAFPNPFDPEHDPPVCC